MNFLAHIYLSFDHEDLMIGNFIGDFVKGNQFEEYEFEMMKGIMLHRAIDEYTDIHAIVQESKQRLRAKYRHYSGVIVDVYYDHFLAANWADYHSTPLEKFTMQTYKTIMNHLSQLPHGAQYMLPYMINNNWLLNYGKLEGINRALTGMSRRTKFHSKMEEAIGDLREHYNEFESEFRAFFDELILFSKDWIARELP